MWQNGGQLVDHPLVPTRLTLDAPLAREATQWFVDLQVRHRVVPDAVEEKAESSESRFLNGRLGMFLNSRRGVPTYRTITSFDWDVAPLPVSPATGREAGWSGSVGLAISPRSRSREAAWKLVEFLAGPEGQATQALSGFQIPNQRPLAATDVFLQPGQRPASAAVFIEAARVQRPGPFTQTPDSKWWTLLHQYLPRAWRGEEDVTTLVRRVKPEIQQALDEAWRDVR